MLFSFLLGIGSGGWLGWPLADKLYAKGGLKHVLKGLAVLQVGIAFLTWAAVAGILSMHKGVRFHKKNVAKMEEKKKA